MTVITVTCDECGRPIEIQINHMGISRTNHNPECLTPRVDLTKKP